MSLWAPLEQVRCRGCGSPERALCSRCYAELTLAPDRERPPSVDRVVAAFAYEGAARQLVLDLKLRPDRIGAEPLLRGLISAIRRDGLVADCITWVPSRPRDRLRRGFDHAQLLAAGVARQTGLPLLGLLRRSGSRPDQATLSRTERWASLAGAFSCRGPVPQRVAVVDDLVTSGATASSCAQTLKMKGTTSVEVISGCRV